MTVLNERSDQAGDAPAPPGQFFAHAPLGPASPTLDDATRRLCAGVYLDDDFAFEVLKETTLDDFRAVPPSLGFDLGPVIHHAYRARALSLVRDLLLTVVLLAGIVVIPLALPTAFWIITAAQLRQRWQRRRQRRATPAEPSRQSSWARSAGAIALLVIITLVGPLILGAFAMWSTLSSSSLYQSEYPGSTTGGSDGSPSLTLIAMIVLLFVLVAATFAILIGFRLAVFRTLITNLADGAAVPLPPLQDVRIARRVAWITGAQRGNITIHSTNPFLGCGRKVVLWSMALLLRGRPAPSSGSWSALNSSAGRHSDGGRIDRDLGFDDVSIRASDLLDTVRRSVLRLADDSLPPSQRVPGVYLLDRLVADGERFQGDPLVDPLSRVPFSVASPEALASIIDHPQGGLRYYLQILIGAHGRPVTTPDGRLVLPAQSQDIVVCAHLHVAVEGGKLYVEFLGTVLPPVRSDFAIVDRLRPRPGMMLLRDTRGLLWDLLASPQAPRRVLRHLRQAFAASSEFRTSHQDMQVFKSYEHGARLSVRERGAEDWPATFLQELDAFKYIKLVEKTVLETVLDYLDTHRVDTTEFRAQATTINHQQTLINSPNFQGPVAFGTGATATKL